MVREEGYKAFEKKFNSLQQEGYSPIGEFHIMREVVETKNVTRPRIVESVFYQQFIML